jgi:hypothetical protein
MPGKRRPGAPVGNTNAVKHGRRSRTRGQAERLVAMMFEAYPEWLANPSQIPEPLVALLLALVERDKSIEEAISRRKSHDLRLNQAVLEGIRQVQISLAERGSPFPQNIENKQPTTINSRPDQSTELVGGRRIVEDQPLETAEPRDQMGQTDQRVN